MARSERDSQRTVRCECCDGEMDDGYRLTITTLSGHVLDSALCCHQCYDTQLTVRSMLSVARESLVSEPTLDLDALGPLGPPNGQQMAGEEVERG